MLYVDAHGVMFIAHCYFKEFGITKGGALCKSDMAMVIWLINFLVLW
jgi:hypothetical protein